MTIWEDWCDQARGLVGKTALDRLWVHIETEDNPIEVWKTIYYLFDKSDDVYSYYL